MYENEIYSDSDVQNRRSETDRAESPVSGSYSTYQTNGVFYGADTQSGGNGNTADRKKKKKEKREPKKGGGFFRKLMVSLSLGLCFGLFAGFGFYAVQRGTGQLEANLQTLTGQQEESQRETGENGTIHTIRPADTSDSADTKIIQVDASEIVRKVMPAMVSIVNNYTVVSSYWGRPYSEQEAASGSGIIVAENDDSLLIVTNNHVVEGTDNLTVTFVDGTEAEAVIKGLDSDMDLAVIAVPLDNLSQDTKNAIAIATLGDSDELEMGEPVIAVGNALGYGQSVTGGMVSALARELTFDDGSKGTFIQTDAAINPGNSGGALLNLKGEVIGINSSKIGGTYVEGMGYAIPITAASPIIADLMERETRTVKVDDSQRGYMGIELQSVTDDVALMFDMPKGAFVYSVEDGLAADRAGLQRGDVIVKFDGQKISDKNDLLDTIQYYKAGETVVVTVERLEDSEYVSYDLEVTLGEMP